MEREQILDVGYGFCLIGGTSRVGIQDRSTFIEERTADHPEFLFTAHEFELAGHNLESGNRLHIVLHIEVAALCLVSFLCF